MFTGVNVDLTSVNDGSGKAVIKHGGLYQSKSVAVGVKSRQTTNLAVDFMWFQDSAKADLVLSASPENQISLVVNSGDLPEGSYRAMELTTGDPEIDKIVSQSKKKQVADYVRAFGKENVDVWQGRYTVDLERIANTSPHFRFKGLKESTGWKNRMKKAVRYLPYAPPVVVYLLTPSSEIEAAQIELEDAIRAIPKSTTDLDRYVSEVNLIQKLEKYISLTTGGAVDDQMDAALTGILYKRTGQIFGSDKRNDTKESESIWQRWFGGSE